MSDPSIYFLLVFSTVTIVCTIAFVISKCSPVGRSVVWSVCHNLLASLLLSEYFIVNAVLVKMAIPPQPLNF